MTAFLRLLVLCSLAGVAGCRAYRLPAPPEAHRPPSVALGQAVVSRSTLPSHLSPTQREEFLVRLRDDLLGTGLFASVLVGEGRDPNDVVITPDYSPRWCFAEPLATVLTLGIVPHPGCYYSGYRLVLRGRRFSQDTVVDNRSRPRALWGWIAGPVSLLPGWSHDPPMEQERQLLRRAIEDAVGASERPAG